ncbi:helix-turn-helix domain-containing protein [Paenibacillus paridis]|uniref:helix-turn-helix domain-containing protein n=1 Tax=Paenibacillus paridis TaxID=2583376 RepID=UPI00111E2F8C|nr:helix-turn-helix domain-containing protein [Paenibacillus paridis]
MGTFEANISNMCDLVANTFEMPVFFISPLGKVVYDNLRSQSINPLFENRTENLFNPLNFKPSNQYSNPVITKSIFSEKYMLISYYNDSQFEGTVIIGPALSSPLPDDRLNGIVNDRRAFFYRESVFQYYKSLPIISTEKMSHICVFIHHLFNRQLLSPKSVKIENSKPNDEHTKREIVNLELSHHILSDDSNQARLFEKKLLYIIKEGRVDEIEELSSIKEEEHASILSKSSYIRSNKNHIITLITLVTRASIEGGLLEEIAFSLHDSFIQQLEELNRLDELRNLARDVLYTFAEKVKQAKNEQHSKKITACKEYIYKHIYEDISHNDIANWVGLSPKYLSTLFRKEVGVSVNEYVQQTKIDEIKKLLAYSNTPISEIGSLLHFNDQSYLTKVFKKIVGVTPKQYRERHHLIENG